MDTPATVKDPVCGNDAIASARRGWDFLFEDIVYYFCGPECRFKFRADPAGFLRPGSVKPKAKTPSAPARKKKAPRTLWSFLKSYLP